MPWKLYRVMLVDGATGRTMWIGDSQTQGNRLADFSKIDDSYCHEVASRLRLQGFVVPLSLGMKIRSITLQNKVSGDLVDRAVVTNVVPGSPADRAGIHKGDIVVAFDGRPVKDQKDLWPVIIHARPGVALQLDIRRNGKQMRLTVVLTVGDD